MSVDMDGLARDILRENDAGGFSMPNQGLYPVQFNWDSAIVAMGFATFDERRAWGELDMLFTGQWGDGMLPHIIFHKPDVGYFPSAETWGSGNEPPTSGITQPPVLATAVRYMVETASDRALAEEKARAFLPKIGAWHTWFHQARDPAGTGLVAILHNWESGRDNSPEWDAALEAVATDDVEPYQRHDLKHVDADQRPRKIDYDRYMALLQAYRGHGWDAALLHDIAPFLVEDVGLNAILLRAEKDLAWLGETLGEPQYAELVRPRIERMEGAFQELWSDTHGLYLSRNRLTDTVVQAPSIGGFLPLFAGAVPADRVARMTQTMTRWLDRLTHGAPSFDPDDARFDPRRYWRGPIWAHINWMVASGFGLAGQGAMADRIKADTKAMLGERGFFEYYDPTTGEGLGGTRFSWTAATWLIWAGRA